MAHFTTLTDLQWQLLEPLFPKPLKRSRGKPHTSWRLVVNSILFVLLNASKWGALPKDGVHYATKSAAHRWFAIWDKNGFLKELLDTYRNMASIASNINLPPRRNRLPASVKAAKLNLSMQESAITG